MCFSTGGAALAVRIRGDVLPWLMLTFTPVPKADPDQLFTVTINLMWQSFYEADDQDVGWLKLDLLVAIGELDCGPWRYLGSTPDVVGVRFTILCNLLDWLLAELGRVTGGLGARVALARARTCLDPDHVS